MKSKISNFGAIVFMVLLFSSNIDPLPTIQPGPVSPMFEYRKHEVKFRDIPSDDVDEDVVIECIWPGSTCII